MVFWKKGKIIVLDNLSSIKVKDPSNIMPLENIMFVLGDVTNDEDLKRVFEKESPQMVFHLAAFFANQNSVDYPEKSAYVDVLGHEETFRIFYIIKNRENIYASSGCAIYGSFPKMPLKEDFISM